MFEVLSSVVIGVLAGWLAGRFMRGNGFGLLGDVMVGIAGALAGGWLFRGAGAEIRSGAVGSAIVALLAALALLFVVRLFTGRRGGRKVWS